MSVLQEIVCARKAKIMEFYKRVSREEMKKGVKVQFVGVYALQWPASEPTDGFVEVEDKELREYLKEKEECEICHGEGSTTDHHDPCSNCGGEGYIT